MQISPFMISSFPRAVAHLDADAFFTSVEQALNPLLRGRPVATGKERGIIACASYEAKALGVRRAMPLFMARKVCPGLVLLPSDYETYSIYSKRIFNIMRNFTPAVEEYSVDEAFADLTGLRRVFRTSYEEIARRMQRRVHEELGITVSVGLSVSKSLAKLCSKFRKPAGFTAVPGEYIHILLQKTPLEKVWGFGPNTVSLLEKLGLRTAYDFAARPESWAERVLHKPGREIWNELRGIAVWKVTTEEKTSYGSIMKSKTFTPAVSDRSFVHAGLVRNVESAFMKMRRYRLRAGAIGVVLRRSDFHHDGLEARLNRPTSSTIEIVPLVREMFDKVFRDGTMYRATMAVLNRLEDDTARQCGLFEDRLKIESLRKLTDAVDAINRKYGKHTLCSATSLFLSDKPQAARDEQPPRRDMVFPGETARQRLAIPRLAIKV